MLRIQRDLLDQQIIDVNGRKVVRVTDVSLEVARAERESLVSSKSTSEFAASLRRFCRE